METKRLAAGTPVEETLNVLQKRLVQAEEGASKLSKHLSKYGFKSSESDENEAARPVKTRLSHTSKSDKVKESMQKSFQDMEYRVSKMENTLSSLKTGINGLEEEGFISKEKYDKEIIELRNKYIKEVKKFEEKLQRANTESDEWKRRNKEVHNELEHLMKSMGENQALMAEKDMAIGNLEEKVDKIASQKDDVEAQLQREVTLRQSLEDAHDALLARCRDMELVVVNGRGQVNELVDNYDCAKHEAVATREAFDNEHELRIQLEARVTQQEQDISMTKQKLKQFLEDKKHMESELSKIKRENKSIRQQIELKTAAHDELKRSYDSLMKDSQKLHEALKIAATDNKALIAQHKESAQREKDRISQQQQIQDKLLDNAKEAVLQELEREKAAVRRIENENTELKAELKNQQSLLAGKEKRIIEFEQKYDIEKDQLSSLVETLRKDKEIIVVQKNDKIFQLQGIIEKIKKENMDYQIKIRTIKEEAERLDRAVRDSRQELEEVKNRLNLAEKNQLSQKQIESAFGEIVESKHKLAYDNGLLQSKVNQLGIELKNFEDTRMDYDKLKRKHEDLTRQHESALHDLQQLKSELSRKSIELQRFKDVVDRNENDTKTIVRAREEALREMKFLSAQNKSREENLMAKISSTESKLKMVEEDNGRLAKSFEAVMSSHSKMEATLEDLQVLLGKKDNEILTLTQERAASQRIVSELQAEMDILQKKIFSLEDVDSEELLATKEAKKAAEERLEQFSDQVRRLEKENCLLKENIEQLKLDIKKKVKQMEEDAREWEVREKELDAKSHRDKEDVVMDYQKQIEKLRDQVRNAQKKISTADEEDAAMKRKLKKLKDECSVLRKEIESCRTDSDSKSRKISDMAVTIEELKFELESAAYKQTKADISTRQFEDEIEKEKFTRMEAESKFMSKK